MAQVRVVAAALTRVRSVRALAMAAAASAPSSAALSPSAVVATAPAAARWLLPQWRQNSSSRSSSFSISAAIGALVTAGLATAAAASAAQCEEAETARSGYAVNPIQNVTALLRLYEEIDKNMEVLTNRMLADLKLRVDKEKEANGGKLTLSPQQLALNMSIEFESTLEKVQDAVFRNNYVTKAQVTEAMQQLIAGELRGGDAGGKITPAEAEAISSYVRRLGRMRWKVTGSRQPLIPTHHKALVKDEKPRVELAVVLEIMEELIPTLTRELEEIAKKLKADGGVSAVERRAQFAHEYARRSGELTEQLCKRVGVDLREFQQALIFYHDDAAFEQALARLSAEQQQRIAELGL